MEEINKRSRFWFCVAIALSVATILDLGVIVGESFDEHLPDSIRCPLVNTFLLLPFDPDYKDHERQVRSRTHCPV